MSQEKKYPKKLKRLVHLVTFRKMPNMMRLKNEQAEVEARINEIEYMLKYARVIDDEEIKSDVVTPGSKVVLAIFGGEEKYTIVGSTEADPYKNKLSYECTYRCGLS